MSVKLLTEQHLEFLSLKGSYTGWSKSTLVKMSNCWKSHALAHLLSVSLDNLYFNFLRYETCVEADIIIESICLVHLLLAER